MPYIKKETRKNFDKEIDALITKINDNSNQNTVAGNLNYIITRLTEASMRGELRYVKLNDIVGALECAKLEIYRRLAAPYEDDKIKESGDVKETSELLSTLIKDIPF